MGCRCRQPPEISILVHASHRWAGIALSIALGIVSPHVLAYTAHYFVVVESRSGDLEVVHHQLVELDGSPQPTTARHASGRHLSRIEARIVDKASGAVRFTTLATGSPWLRGEFHGNGTIDGRMYPLDSRHYVVRVPVEPAASLELRGLDAEPSARSLSTKVLAIDLDNVAPLKGTTATKAPGLPPGWSSGTIVASGPPSNRLDLLVIAEGYTADQQARFVADATALVNAFLDESPYSAFRQLINVDYLFVPSNQSGADRPNCSDTKVDTAFDATFCTAGADRLLTVDPGKVLTAAANVADWDKLLVVVNSDVYGGSGGFAAVATTHADSAEIMQHEFGHQFTELDDEYETPNPGFPTCSDIEPVMQPRCGPNVTDVTARALIKWRGWIEASTPIPTVNPIADPLGAGLWSGARYGQPGMHRQCFNGKMKELNRPFCHVDSEAFVKRLYEGWHGVPATGISNIDPTAMPATAGVVVPIGSDVDFSATIVGSTGDNALTYAWLVDGQVAKSGTASHNSIVTFTYRVADSNLHPIVLRVTDATNLLLQPNTSTKTWAVTDDTPRVVEFYNATLDHYFVTANVDEARAVDGGAAGPGWVRTGGTFRPGGNVAVCRFYGSLSPGPNSHFFTADAAECAALKALQAATPATQKRWNYESLDFLTTLPVNRQCAPGTLPVYRAYNDGFVRGRDSNHRLTTSREAIDGVVARGWIDEGVVMCAPAGTPQ